MLIRYNIRQRFGYGPTDRGPVGLVLRNWYVGSLSFEEGGAKLHFDDVPIGLLILNLLEECMISIFRSSERSISWPIPELDAELTIRISNGVLWLSDEADLRSGGTPVRSLASDAISSGYDVLSSIVAPDWERFEKLGPSVYDSPILRRIFSLPYM